MSEKTPTDRFLTEPHLVTPSADSDTAMGESIRGVVNVKRVGPKMHRQRQLEATLTDTVDGGNGGRVRHAESSSNGDTWGPILDTWSNIAPDVERGTIAESGGYTIENPAHRRNPHPDYEPGRARREVLRLLSCSEDDFEFAYRNNSRKNAAALRRRDEIHRRVDPHLLVLVEGRERSVLRVAGWLGVNKKSIYRAADRARIEMRGNHHE